MLDPRRHSRSELLGQKERGRDIYAKRLLPFVRRDLGERFYDGDPGVVDQEIKGLTNLLDQIGYSLGRGKIVNQADDFA